MLQDTILAFSRGLKDMEAIRIHVLIMTGRLPVLDLVCEQQMTTNWYQGEWVVFGTGLGKANSISLNIWISI